MLALCAVVVFRVPLTHLKTANGVSSHLHSAGPLAYSDGNALDMVLTQWNPAEEFLRDLNSRLRDVVVKNEVRQGLCGI